MVNGSVELVEQRMWWQKAINDRKKEKMSIMIENFWDSVRRDERCKLYKNFMIYEKNIYLDENNDDVGQLNVIVIGVSPYNQMKVYARIESRMKEVKFYESMHRN